VQRKKVEESKEKDECVAAGGLRQRDMLTAVLGSAVHGVDWRKPRVGVLPSGVGKVLMAMVSCMMLR